MDFAHALWQAVPHRLRRNVFDRAVASAALLNSRSLRATGTKSPIYVMGALRSPTGLGEAARLAVLALRAEGVDVRPIDAGAWLRQPATIAFNAPWVLSDGPGVLLVFANPPVSSYLVARLPRAFLADKLRIGCWVWEYDNIPSRWHKHARVFHAIAAPSEYCRRVLSSGLQQSVHYLPHPVGVASVGKIQPKARGEFVIGFVGDMISAAGRKNPSAVIDAAALVFSNDPCVRLVMNLPGLQDGSAIEATLRERAQGAGLSIEIDNRRLDRQPHAERLSRLNCYVSLHRAEGFGLTIAEAMAAGLPVIATATPAVAEYLDKTVGYPVPWTAKAAPPLVDLAQPGTWAEPDLRAAAASLHKIRRDSNRAFALGAMASTRISEQFSTRAFRTLLDDIIQSSEHATMPGTTPGLSEAPTLE